MLIGIDSLESVRVETLINNNKFLSKCFTAYEAAYLSTRPSRTLSLAGLFCAKESFLKALGIGVLNGIELNEVEVRHRESGKPYLNLSDNAKSKMLELGVSNSEISITHTHTLSSAICILY